MKEIFLTLDKIALVDDEDYERVNQYKWQAQPHHTGKMWYAKRTINLGNGSFTTMRMARFILDVEAETLIDHRDRDTLNNQKYNLRLASSQQNAANAGPRGASSGYKGVHWNESAKKWQVSRKGRYIGVFSDVIEAARAFDAIAYKEDGEFAYLNFPLHEKAGE